jgi:hypothetical protein
VPVLQLTANEEAQIFSSVASTSCAMNSDPKLGYGSTVLDGYLILLITARFWFLQNNQNQRVARAFGYLKNLKLVAVLMKERVQNWQ